MKKNGPKPASWAVKNWPADVYPGSAKQARHIVRRHQQALLDCGALTRVGRELVIMSDAYTRWLVDQREHVRDFQIPPNKKK